MLLAIYYLIHSLNVQLTCAQTAAKAVIPDDLQFSIWSSTSTQSKSGVLMASIKDEDPLIPICGRISVNDKGSYLDKKSAQYICESMNYQKLISTGRAGQRYVFAETYRSRTWMPYSLRCSSSKQCAYKITKQCYYIDKKVRRAYFTTIMCSGCKANSYISGVHCISCPAGAVSKPDSKTCSCLAGQYWVKGNCPVCPANTYSRVGSTSCTRCPANSDSTSGSGACNCKAGLYMDSAVCKTCPANYYSLEGSTACSKCPPNSNSKAGSSICNCPRRFYFNSSQGSCEMCPEDTYSLGGKASCRACVPGSHAPPGSDHCDCSGGLFMDQGVCKVCPDNQYSYQGATSCQQCPGGLTSEKYQSFCTCSTGAYWNLKEHNCFDCPDNYYMDKTNSTGCIQCPERSTATTHATTCDCEAGYYLVKIDNTPKCEICPENHFSKAGSLNCTQCPHFKAAAPGSEYCYRCTLGQYWENHTCLQCPSHLFGDGVHCNECPEGFDAEKGFCYKINNETGETQELVREEKLDRKTITLLLCLMIVGFSVVVVVILMWVMRSKIAACASYLSEITKKGQSTMKIRLVDVAGEDQAPPDLPPPPPVPPNTIANRECNEETLGGVVMSNPNTQGHAGSSGGCGGVKGEDNYAMNDYQDYI